MEQGEDANDNNNEMEDVNGENEDKMNKNEEGPPSSEENVDSSNSEMKNLVSEGGDDKGELRKENTETDLFTLSVVNAYGSQEVRKIDDDPDKTVTLTSKCLAS